MSFDLLDLTNLTGTLGATLLPNRGAPHITEVGQTVRIYSNDGNVSRVNSDGISIPQDFTFEFDLTPVVLPQNLDDLALRLFYAAAQDVQDDIAALVVSKDAIALVEDEDGFVVPAQSSANLFVEGTKYTVRLVVDGSNNLIDVYVTETADVGTTGHQLRYTTGTKATPQTMADGFRFTTIGAVADAVEMILHTLRVSSSLLIPNRRPVAVASDVAGIVGQALAIDGTGSYDPENEPITYVWTFTSVPTGSNITDASLFPTVGKSVPVTGTDLVANGTDQVSSATSDFVAANVLPGDLVDLDVFPNTASVLEVLSATTLRLSKSVPTGTGITFTVTAMIPGKNDSKPAFIPDVGGTYELQLTVNDGALDSLPLVVIVTAATSFSARGYTPSAQELFTVLSDFYGDVTDKNMLQVFWSAVMQLAAADLLILYQNDRNKSIDTIGRQRQRRWLDYDARIEMAEEITLHEDQTAQGTDGRVVYLTGDDLQAFGTTTVTSASADFGAQGVIAGFHLHLDTSPYLAKVVGVSGNSLDLDQSIPVGTGIGFSIGSKKIFRDPAIDFVTAGVTKDSLLYMDTGTDTYMRTVQAVFADHLSLNEDLPVFVGADWHISPLRLEAGELSSDLWLRDGDVGIWNVRTIATNLDTEVYTDLEGYSLAAIGSDDTGIAAYLADATTYEVTFVGFYRTSQLPLHESVESIPWLQSIIKDPPDTDLLTENIDYRLEEDSEGNKSITFVVPYTSSNLPPDTFWAEYTHLSNASSIEDNFGRDVGLLQTSAAVTSLDFDYLSAVQGLLYCYLFGPSVENLRLGVHIFCGLPFAAEDGTIVSIEHTYNATHGRIVVTPTTGGNLRTYFYKRSLGLAVNPDTNLEYIVGNTVSRFAPLSKGVEIIDFLIDALWFKSMGVNELQKYYTFTVGLDSDILDDGTKFNDLVVVVVDFVRAVKPIYTEIVAAINKLLDDSISVTDSLAFRLAVHFIEKVGLDSRAGYYGEVKSDGTPQWLFGSGLTYGHHAEIYPEEDIELSGCTTGGVVPTYGNIFMFGDPIQYGAATPAGTICRTMYQTKTPPLGAGPLKVT